jgi:hypothetical protein
MSPPTSRRPGAMDTGPSGSASHHSTSKHSVTQMSTSHAAAVLPESEASRLTERIRLLAGSTADQLVKLKGLVDEAQAGQVHITLGYASWPAYLSDVLAALHLALDREHRRELVSYLSGKGMSTRAIAPVVGVSKDTVARDLLPGVSDETPGKRLVDLTSGDSEATPELFAPGANNLPDSDADPPVSDATRGVISPRRKNLLVTEVTGLDGKRYPRPKPKDSLRRPITDSYRDAAWHLQKSLERLQRLHADDRFLAEREHLNRIHWRNLSDLGEVFDAIQNDLSGHYKCHHCAERMVPGSPSGGSFVCPGCEAEADE